MLMAKSSENFIKPEVEYTPPTRLNSTVESRWRRRVFIIGHRSRLQRVKLCRISVLGIMNIHDRLLVYVHHNTPGLLLQVQ